MTLESENKAPGEGDQEVSITVRDVLRAVFLPPRDAEPLALPSLPALRLWPLPAERVAPLDLGQLAEPTVIHYEETPIESVAEASSSRAMVLGIGTVVTLLIAYLAQSSLSNAGNGFAGGLLYGMAVLVWMSLLMFEVAPPDGGLLRRGPCVTGGGVARPVVDTVEGLALSSRGLLGAMALILSVMTYILTGGNLFRPVAVVTWVLSVAVWMVVVAERSPSAFVGDVTEWVRSCVAAIKRVRRWILPLLGCLAILAVAGFFRFHRLEAIPNEMTSDHVEKLLDAYDVSQGIYHVFFTRNGGREAIQFYLVALAARLFGTGMSFLTLKLVTALEALALIPLLVLLGREVVDRETGLFTAALVAVSWWHTALGRLGLRIVLTPVVFTLLLVTLLRGIRSGSRRAWIWAGVWMGVGVYAYQAMRIAPLVAVVAFLVSVSGPVVRAALVSVRRSSEAAYHRAVAANTLERQALNLVLAGVIALAIFVPMLRVWHDYPGELWNRVINRTTSNEVAIQGAPWQIFIDNYFDALYMFNVEGDQAWISALPGAPMLDLIGGGLLVLGIVAWLLRLRARRNPADVFVLLAGMIMLLPSALAIAFPIENPSATRASGALPVVFVLAAWPLALIRQRWQMVMGRPVGVVLGGLLVAALLSISAMVNYETYFVKFAESYRRSALNPSEVAQAVRAEIGSEAGLEGVWLQGWPFWHDYRAIGIEAGDITFSQAILDVSMLQSYLESYPESFAVRPLVFIVHPSDSQALEVLEGAFPEGEAQLYQSTTPGRDFYLYVVPAERTDG